MRILSLFFLLDLAMNLAMGDQRLFYLGTYTDHSESKGIYRGTLDDVSGKLGPITLATLATDPSFLGFSPNGRYLYASEEVPDSGKIKAFRCTPNGDLAALNEASAAGNGTCHVIVDPSSRDVLVANYESGSIACFRLRPDGSLDSRTALIQLIGSGPNATRQKGPHAHCVLISPDDAFVYCCDLGTDRTWIFKLDAQTGSLTANDPPYAHLPPGSGPRHMILNRLGNVLYVVNEMGHSVCVLARNSTNGNLTLQQTISTLPSDNSTPETASAEIALHPTGKWLYVSNRGSDSISTFAVSATGQLALIQNEPAGLISPRSFAIDPTGRWMITAGQNDNRIAVLRIDPLTGKLSATLQSARVPSPVCVLFKNKI